MPVKNEIVKIKNNRVFNHLFSSLEFKKTLTENFALPTKYILF